MEPPSSSPPPDDEGGVAGAAAGVPLLPKREESAPDEVENEENAAAQAGLDPADPPKPAESSAILKLKGLPYDTNEASVRSFFADYSLESVKFVYEPDGRPSGLGFAEFADRDEALKALSKNGDFMGERYVRLLHVPVTEMEEQVRLGTLAVPGNAAKLRNRMAQQQQRTRRGLPSQPMQLVPTMVPSALYTMAPRPMYPQGLPMWRPFGQQQFAGLQQAHVVQHQGLPQGHALHSGHGQPQGQQQGHALQQGLQQGQQQGHGLPQGQQQSHVLLQGQQQAHALQQQAHALQQQGYVLQQGQQQQQGYVIQQDQGQRSGPLPVGLQMPPPPPPPPPPQPHSLPPGIVLHAGAGGAGGPAMLQQQLQQQQLQQLQGGRLQLHAQHAQQVQAQVMQQVGTSPVMSATVKVRGLPYRSTPSDILHFFQGYQYLPDSMQIGLDSVNRPSGESWLTFATPAEAARAVTDLNRHYLV
ncbi:hypothetical protein FOA52_005201 [Chlamydomonas sp. UWO 241]|nr:hypothetical protein FOA52_005201 [Chlamydomonas sp. UWO 241]